MNRLAVAWLLLGAIGSLLLGLLSWILVGPMRLPFYNYLVIGMFILGFLPGLFGSFTLRFVGLVGLLGILVGIVWGFVDAVFGKIGYLWPAFFVFDMVKIMMIALSVGFLAQFIVWFIPKKKRRRNYAIAVD